MQTPTEWGTTKDLVAGVLEDGIGEYVVLNKAAVSSEVVFKRGERLVGKVPVGAVVKVVELEHLPEQRRIRGRLLRPAGWMSLLDTGTGRRWAAKLLLCPLKHALLRKAADCGGCDLCGKGLRNGCTVLRCDSCDHNICPRCVRRGAPLRAWTYRVNAGVETSTLGFVHSVVVSPMRVTICDVQAGSWAGIVGVRPGDELVAINGINVEKVTPEELDLVLEEDRPLDFTFAYNGSDMETTSRNTITSAMLANDLTSVVISITLNHVNFAMLAADSKLFAAFKAIIQDAVVTEVGGGIPPESVQLGFSAGSALLVRCVVSQLSEAASTAARLRLSRCAAFGQDITVALNKLDRIAQVSTKGYVSVGMVEVTAMPKERTTWMRHRLGFAKGFLRRFMKDLSANPSATAGSDTETALSC